MPICNPWGWQGVPSLGGARLGHSPPAVRTPHCGVGRCEVVPSGQLGGGSVYMHGHVCGVVHACSGVFRGQREGGTRPPSPPPHTHTHTPCPLRIDSSHAT